MTKLRVLMGVIRGKDEEGARYFGKLILKRYQLMLSSLVEIVERGGKTRLHSRNNHEQMIMHNKKLLREMEDMGRDFGKRNLKSICDRSMEKLLGFQPLDIKTNSHSADYSSIPKDPFGDTAFLGLDLMEEDPDGTSPFDTGLLDDTVLGTDLMILIFQKCPKKALIP